MTSASHRKTLFISHATPEDNNFARWLGAKLSAMGYEVWADVLRLRGGSDWSRELEIALRQHAFKMLLVCTPGGLDKQGVRNEIEIGAQLSKQLNDPAFVVPLRLEAFDAPFRIAHLQYIDFKTSWAQGLAELVQLLIELDAPRALPIATRQWVYAQAVGSARLLNESETLLSNWLGVTSLPPTICYCEPAVGLHYERFQTRASHRWPVVPHRRGVLTFSRPDKLGEMQAGLPGTLTAELATLSFLESGWNTLGIAPHQAQKVCSDLATQGFDRFAERRGLKGYVGSGRRVSWWADIKTGPLAQVRLGWASRNGSRQVIGKSDKRGVHWHYAISVNLRVAPVPHFRVASRLVFSENGLDALEDVRRTHSLRRSLARGWRNARWRDMLCAYLWFLSDGQQELAVPVGEHVAFVAQVPPLQFDCPISASTETVDTDEDDPDMSDDEWNIEQLDDSQGEAE